MEIGGAPMKKSILVLAAALFLGGCAVYAEPPVGRLYVPGPPPVYVAPPPVVVSPYPYWGWRHPHRWQN